MLKEIPQPKSDQVVTKTGILVNKKVMIMTIYKSARSVVIYLGGKNNMFCLEVCIPLSGSQGNLPHIDYDITCSIDNSFERGVDTSAMLNRILHYIGVNYPHITTLRFSDSSNRVCDNGQTIDLSEMGYITTGKTWYERHYSAYLEEDDVPKFTKCDTRFQELKSKWSWEVVKSEIDFRKLYNSVSEEELEVLYNSTYTWQDFFGGIVSRIGIAQFCIFAAPWLHSFIYNNMRYTFGFASYIMPVPVPKSSTINYITNIPAKTGGTRKKFKRRVRFIYF